MVTSHYCCFIVFSDEIFIYLPLHLHRIHSFRSVCICSFRCTFRSDHDRVSLWEEGSSVLFVTTLVTLVHAFVGFLCLAKKKTVPSPCKDHIKPLCICTRDVDTLALSFLFFSFCLLLKILFLLLVTSEASSSFSFVVCH